MVEKIAQNQTMTSTVTFSSSRKNSKETTLSVQFYVNYLQPTLTTPYHPIKTLRESSCRNFEVFSIFTHHPTTTPPPCRVLLLGSVRPPFMWNYKELTLLRASTQWVGLSCVSAMVVARCFCCFVATTTLLLSPHFASPIHYLDISNSIVYPHHTQISTTWLFCWECDELHG